MIRVVSAAWPVLGVRALTTCRVGGVSQGPYASLNLAMHVGDSARDVATNRAAAARACTLPADPLWLDQIHGRHVVDAGQPWAAPPRADGSFTTRRGAICAVLTADCLPVVLAARDASCVAVLHAGWRGLAAGILEAGVAALPVASSGLAAWLGPAIGAGDYEVGEEVRQAFGDRADAAFTPTRAGHYRADLYALARQRLRALGVTAIYGGGLNTFRDPDLYSYRQTPVCGRMATLAWIA
ncbi:peptidoglycan editing factor PgeF [Acidiferrobacter sp.]|uniref:peptidoglycan editing factor PgeF n=1 Tax=Acidiferrobacter sp. TaxID=1872107 RepID=UPI0026118454|nr:peptidoglycan editing factor PgeF [Acidiferrobacter sp.]